VISFSQLLLAILDILSSSVRLDRGRRWTAIFRFLQRCLIGLKPRLWLGHSKTFTELSIIHSCIVFTVCFGSLSCWKANFLPSPRFWMLWTRFALRLTLYILLLLWQVSPSLPLKNTPTAWGCYTYTLLLVLCRWWAVPAFLQTWCLELRYIRPENIVSHSLRESFRYFFANSKWVFMHLHWGEQLCCKSQIGGVLQWCLSICKCLPSLYMIMELNQSDRQVLGHNSNLTSKSLLHWLLSLTLGRVLAVLKFFH